MSYLGAWMAALSAARASEVRQRLRRARLVLSEPIRRAPDRKPPPLSFAQERLWFLEQLQPGNGAYHVALTLRPQVALDPAMMEWSLNAVVRRHEVLRTRFVALEGRPVQLVLPELWIPVPVTDLSAWPDGLREDGARRLAEEEWTRPFDVSSGPLLRARLARLGARDWLFLVTLHHLVADGWSIGILQSELTALYDGGVTGRPPSLPPLPLQYADYAVWQRKRLQGAELERQLGYWRRQLADAPALLSLPTDRPRPSTQTFRGGAQAFAVDRAALQGLRALGQRAGATLFMVLLGAFAVLLGRYARQDEVMIGSPIAGRLRSELEALIGLFANTLVLRLDLGGGPSFRQLLRRVREVTLDAYDHQELPFERLVEELKPERSLSYNPLFQVMFVLQNLPAAAGGSDGPAAAGAVAAKFDLTLSMSEGEAGLWGTLEYNCDLFEAPTAARLAEHLATLLAGAAADPDRPVGRLPLMGEDEQWQVTAGWNRTAGPLPVRPLHEWIAQRARQSGDAVALVFDDLEISYAELERRANRVAHRLRASGVGPDVLVALCLERSPELVAGLLGVLKAGGAYVPLDPAYPRDRLAFMLSDSAARVLLTQRGLLESLPAAASEVICLDDPDELAGQPDHGLDAGATRDHLAYVIYTSGSTGRPKGVAIPHQGLCNVTAATAGLFGHAPGRRVLQFASASFDASIWEMAQTLVSGATLILARREDLVPGPPLAALVRRQRIDLLTLPPSALPLLSPAELPGLQTLVLGGEACPAPLVAPWLAAGRRCFNAYGPTEISVCATVAACLPAAAVLPIGRPVTNLRVYLLDGYGQPSAIGVPGEIHIGGAGLARGYHRRPDLTAERFLPDPFAAEPGLRLYRSGDLGRRRPDGEIEFLGRLDEQVKLRGFRIELGEIESVLLADPAVAEAAVVLRREAGEDARLVAYVAAAREQEPPTAAELRRVARERLPEHMLPADFVLLPALPKTASGKLDRRALPAPERIRSGGSSYQAPRTPLEAGLERVWAETLGLERVGVDDDFFELGGHSLLMTQVVSRLRDALGLEVSLRDFFAEPTIARLAELLAARQPDSPARAEEGPIQPVPRAARRVRLSSLEGPREPAQAGKAGP
jgi:amino acid adenylation domain-containing protein